MTTAELIYEQQTDPHLVAGRYRLLARIGRGRLGEIYKAADERRRDPDVERHVAVQLLPDSIALDQELFAKLKFGYTALRAVPHPNIVRFLDFDHDGKFGYLVTDFLEGASLRYVLDDMTTLPLDEAIPVIRAIGDALKFLHVNHMVHGRLTAENVVITYNEEVRLLDVVPLDSTTTLPGSVASTDPFSRCDIANDIYGLACLAYEMLGGKHPFDFQVPAEAHRKGLEPARIASLPEQQWKALCHALSFDREQRTPSVAEFLLEFGGNAAELLRTSERATETRDPSSSHPVSNVLLTAHSGESSSSPSTATPSAPAAWTDTTPQLEVAPYTARAKDKRAGRMPSPILLMALVGLSAWFFVGQPHDDLARLTDYVEPYLGGESPGSSDGASPITAYDLAPAASEDTGPASNLAATATQPVVEDEARAEATGASLVAGETAISEVTEGTTDNAAAEPADESLADADPDAAQSDEAIPTDELASTSDSDSSSESESEFTLIQSVAYVSERDGAARIATRNPGNADGQIVWWTSDNTASAEDDYIPIERPVEGFASGEEIETLHIPLVNDSLPEPQENFYVYLGRHDAELGRLEPIASVRVEISDDD